MIKKDVMKIRTMIMVVMMLVNSTYVTQGAC